VTEPAHPGGDRHRPAGAEPSRGAERDGEPRTGENGRREHADLIAKVVHELRNPLQSLLLRAQMAARGDARSLERLPAMVTKQITSVLELVSDLVDDARLDADMIALVPKPFDLGELVDEAVVRAALEPGQELSVREHGPVPVEGDRERLARVIAIYLGNAIKRTPEGGRVELALVTDQELARVEVSDTSSAIAPEDCPRVFDRSFHATSATRGSKTIGLGLSVCRRLVELHGGRVGASADPQGGTTFWFEVPRHVETVP
jgi:signal transduction histidine kinase